MSDYVAIPEKKKDGMKTIELSVDVMLFNKIPFVISLEKYEVHHNRKRGGSEGGYPIKSSP